jgi:hypothetical protein
MSASLVVAWIAWIAWFEGPGGGACGVLHLLLADGDLVNWNIRPVLVADRFVRDEACQVISCCCFCKLS